MFLALVDLVQFKFRFGRYGDHQKDGGMALAFWNEIPDSVIAKLEDRDLIFTQRLNTVLSWGLLYFTGSRVDHMGAYVGDGKILHMTFGGSKVHSLRAVAKGARVLIVRMGQEEATRWMYQTQEWDKLLDKRKRWFHRLPAKLQVLWGGLLVIHGYFPERFSLLRVADLWIGFALLDFACRAALGTHVLAPLLIASIGATIANLAVSWIRKTRNLAPRTMSLPDYAYSFFFNSGGLMFTRIGEIAVFKDALLPLKVVLGLARQSPDDGADDKLKEAGEFFRSSLKGWNIEIPTEKPEANDCDQIEN